MNRDIINQVQADRPALFAEKKALGLPDEIITEVILRQMEEEKQRDPNAALKAAAMRAVRLFLALLNKLHPLAEKAITAIQKARDAGIEIEPVPELEGMPMGNGELAENLRLAEEANAKLKRDYEYLDEEHRKLQSIDSDRAKRCNEYLDEIESKDARIKELEAKIEADAKKWSDHLEQEKAQSEERNKALAELNKKLEDALKKAKPAK